MLSVRVRFPDFLAAACVALALGALYSILRQINLPEDAPVFLDLFSPAPPAFHPHHPLFGRLLHAAIRIGARFGLDAATAGAAQSAIFSALACGALVLAMRARGVSLASATLLAALVGSSATVLVNATTVELYAACLLAVVLNLAAFGAAARRIRGRSPSPSGAGPLSESLARIGFAITAAALVAMHLGFGPWALAGWLALASLDRGAARRVLRVAEGALVLALLLAWLWIESPPREEVLAGARSLARDFGRISGPRDLLILPFLAPLFGFAMHAGLAIFPSTTGARSAPRRASEDSASSPASEDSDLGPERRLALLAVPLFLAIYSFWTIDSGSFFLPLIPLAALFAARAWDRAARSGRRARTLAAGGLALHAALFVLLPGTEFFAIAPRSVAAFALAAAFLLWVAGLAFASGFLAEHDESPSRRRLGYALVASLAISLQLASAFPLASRFVEPDIPTLALREFDAIAPPEARLVARLPEPRPRRQTEREVLPALDSWHDPARMRESRKTLERWLQETVGPRARPLYFDEASRRDIDFLWGRYGEPPWISIPYENFEFLPVVSGGSLFHRLEWNPARRVEERLRQFDPHPPERWGENEVRWTRRVALLEVEPGARLSVRYWVGHERIGPNDPVRVTFSMDGASEPLARRDHVASELGTIELEIPAATSLPARRLRVEVDPFWIALDGRELGVALYEFQIVRP